MVISAVVAGPPLWALVRSGGMSLITALQQAGVVAAACAVGVVGINRLVRSYAAEQVHARRVAQALAAREAIVHEGTPVPPPGGTTP